MRPSLIVVQPPVFNDDLCFETISEPLRRKAFISELAVEAFIRTVLPRLSRTDQGRFNPLLKDPTQQRCTDKLRAISLRR